MKNASKTNEDAKLMKCKMIFFEKKYQNTDNIIGLHSTHIINKKRCTCCPDVVTEASPK